MNIKGGALEFDIIANNGQINSALEETKKRVKGFTDATVEGGDKMEAAYKKAAETIEAAWKDIDTMTNTHQGAIAELEKEYAKLGEAAGHAFQKGTAKGDEEYRSLTQKQQAVQAEINQRKQLLQEIGTTADALLKEEQTLNSNREKVEQNQQAKGRLRTQVMNLKQALAEAEQAGKRDTDEYRTMQAELGRLTDAMGDANTQAKIMADDYRNLNTVAEVISGVTGAFSAAQGAVGLFAGENENLQKIMVKVQSLMAITIGLQQVSKMLNKDSYTQLVLVRRAKELLAVAEAKFATALGISNVMAKALMATLTLGLSVAITAIVIVLDRFITKNQEAKKAQDEFNKKVADTAASAIANFNALSYAWGQLGNNLEAKQKFVDQNADKFKELGFSINTVKQAEDLLVANSSRFVAALMQRAKATATAELAVEQYKKAIEAQNTLDRTPKAYVSKKGTYTDGYGTKREGTVMVKDSKWQEAEDDLAKQQEAYEKLIAQQANFTAEEKKILASIGADSATITEGSINALEDQISKLQAKYKEAGNDQERAKYLEQIQATQKTLDKITAGSKNTSGGSSTSKGSDPFLAQLEERKKKYTEYYKWVNSKDDIVRNAAKTEFAGLLKEGASYIEYLKNQREQILAVDVANRSKAQNKQLRMLNDQIAEETNKTVLEAFNTELSDQLSNAKTVMEMLNIIAQKRKALSNDNTEVDNSKKDTLDEAEKTALQKQKEETDSLLEEYASYLDKKIKLEMDYNNDITLLEKRRSQATTDADKEKINQAIANRNKQYQKDTKGTGDADYDAMVNEYLDFEERKDEIIDKYDKKRRIAKIHDDQKMMSKLIIDQKNEISQLASKNLYKDVIDKFYKEIESISLKEIYDVIDKINNKKIEFSSDMTDDDIKNLKRELNNLAIEIASKNPFTALSNAVRTFKNDASSVTFSEVLRAGGDLSVNFAEISDSMRNIAKTIGSEKLEAAADVIDDVITNIQAAESGAEAWGGWWGAIIGGVTDLIPKIIKWASGDRKIEKQIKKHADAVRDLQNAYNELSWAIDKALGGAVYKSQQAAISNMKAQKEHLKEMWEGEISKKKTDWDKVAQYKEQYAELGRSIEDMIADITESITQTSAKNLADKLADAIAETFTDGFNSKQVNQAIEKVVKQVMQNAVKNALKLQFLETPLQAAIQQLQKDMGFDSEGNGSFDGLSAEEQARFKAKVQAIAANYTEALKMYEDLFKDLEDDSDPSSSLSGAIKGASQESIDLLAGQTNAVRVNQVEGIDILRQQLVHLASIDGKMGASNLLLSQIYDELKGTASDPLRAQGITI